MSSEREIEDKNLPPVEEPALRGPPRPAVSPPTYAVVEDKTGTLVAPYLNVEWPSRPSNGQYSLIEYHKSEIIKSDVKGAAPKLHRHKISSSKGASGSGSSRGVPSLSCSIAGSSENVETDLRSTRSLIEGRASELPEAFRSHYAVRDEEDAADKLLRGKEHRAVLYKPLKTCKERTMPKNDSIAEDDLPKDKKPKIRTEASSTALEKSSEDNVTSLVMTDPPDPESPEDADETEASLRIRSDERTDNDLDDDSCITPPDYAVFQSDDGEFIAPNLMVSWPNRPKRGLYSAEHHTKRKLLAKKLNSRGKGSEDSARDESTVRTIFTRTDSSKRSPRSLISSRRDKSRNSTSSSERETSLRSTDSSVSRSEDSQDSPESSDAASPPRHGRAQRPDERTSFLPGRVLKTAVRSSAKKKRTKT